MGKLTEKWLDNIHKKMEEDILNGSKNDPINPSHYKQGKYETIDIILDRVSRLPGDQAAIMSNIIRYLWRYDNKNGKEDLEKAQWYLKRLVEVVADGEDKI